MIDKMNKFIIVFLIFFSYCKVQQHIFYLKPEEFMVQLKTHRDTVKVNFRINHGLFLSEIINTMLGNNNGHGGAMNQYEYCNFKFFYYFRDFTTNQIDTIKNTPYTTIKIKTKNNIVCSFKLFYLKSLNDSLIGEMYFYTGTFRKSKKTINFDDIDSIFIYVSKNDYNNKSYKYKNNQKEKKCVENFY